MKVLSLFMKWLGNAVTGRRTGPALANGEIVPLDRYAVRYALPSFEAIFRESDDLNVRSEVSRSQVFVEHRGGGLWCVVDEYRRAYDREGNVEYEPTPSERDREFLDRYRFPRGEAMRVAAAALPGIVEARLGRAREARAIAEGEGRHEQAAFLARVIELVERGIQDAQAEFLGERAAL